MNVGVDEAGADGSVGQVHYVHPVGTAHRSLHLGDQAVPNEDLGGTLQGVRDAVEYRAAHQHRGTHGTHCAPEQAGPPVPGGPDNCVGRHIDL